MHASRPHLREHSHRVKRSSSSQPPLPVLNSWPELAGNKRLPTTGWLGTPTMFTVHPNPNPVCPELTNNGAAYVPPQAGTHKAPTRDPHDFAMVATPFLRCWAAGVSPAVCRCHKLKMSQWFRAWRLGDAPAGNAHEPGPLHATLCDSQRTHGRKQVKSLVCNRLLVLARVGERVGPRVRVRAGECHTQPPAGASPFGFGGGGMVAQIPPRGAVCQSSCARRCRGKRKAETWAAHAQP